MLAIDTNLVVRYLIADDTGQAAKAKRLIDNSDVFVCTTVMLETEWVLRSVYEISTERRAKASAEFAGLARVTLEDPASVASALAWMYRVSILPTACILPNQKAARLSSASTRISQKRPTLLVV